MIAGTFSTWVVVQADIGGRQIMITLIPQSRGNVQQNDSGGNVHNTNVHPVFVPPFFSSQNPTFTPFVTSQKECYSRIHRDLSFLSLFPLYTKHETSPCTFIIYTIMHIQFDTWRSTIHSPFSSRYT